MSVKDKTLFTIDLINHVILSTRPTFANKIIMIPEQERLKCVIHDAFNETVKKGVECIDVIQNESVRNEFVRMLGSRSVNKASFLEYAKNERETTFVNGFQERLFLKYCVRMANMAGYFMTAGVKDAPVFAADSIMEAFPDGVMSIEAWDRVTRAAESYITLAGGYFPNPTPRDSISQSPSSAPGTSGFSMNVQRK